MHKFSFCKFKWLFHQNVTFHPLFLFCLKCTSEAIEKKNWLILCCVLCGSVFCLCFKLWQLKFHGKRGQRFWTWWYVAQWPNWRRSIRRPPWPRCKRGSAHGQRVQLGLSFCNNQRGAWSKVLRIGKSTSHHLGLSASLKLGRWMQFRCSWLFWVVLLGT